MCVYQFRHLGNATYNFTFPPETCQRNHPSPPSLRPARKSVRASNLPRATGPLRRDRLRPPCRAALMHAARTAPTSILRCCLRARQSWRRCAMPARHCPPPTSTRELGVGPVAREAFHGRLAAMERDGQLLTNRKGELCVVAKLDLVIGTVQGHPDGFGFLVPDEGGDDYFLNPREMHKVLHGDRAALRKTGIDRRGRPEGEIVEVLERANREVVGRLHEEHGIWFVVAENRRINQDMLVAPGDLERRDDRDRWSSPRSSSSPRPTAKRSRASRKCWAAPRIPASKSRSRCASTRCRSSSRRKRSGRPGVCRRRSAPPTARIAST